MRTSIRFRGLLGGSAFAFALSSLISISVARADDFAGRYPEEVVQWGVQKGETCEDIAIALYGNARYAYLVQRYNHVGCTRGAPLKEGMTLVVPAKVTQVPTAHISGLHPKVNAKEPGGSWAPAASGQPLETNASVSTEEDANAGIQFVDRTKVFLAQNTLVIIYGTASQSVVSKNQPSAIELDQGEVKAALSALRGEDEVAVDVGVKGGGNVSASSKDTVVQRKADQTTVEVFDGKAKVQNAGAVVTVPTNFGTRFIGTAPPVPPRPLPPAPVWSRSSSSLVVATKGSGVLRGSWEAVPKAKAYRIEIATDDAFEQLLTRREVSATVTSFEIDKFPPGFYWARVRAIDTEDYLGIATSAMRLGSVEATFERGNGTIGEKIATSANASLRFVPVAGVELSVGDAPFAPLPETLDLAATKPAKLRFRVGGEGGALTEIPIEYSTVTATINLARVVGSDEARLEVQFTEADGTVVPFAVSPSARIHRGAAVELVALTGDAKGTFATTIHRASTVTDVDVLDSGGSLLGSKDISGSTVTTPKPVPSTPSPLGVTASMLSLGAYGAPLWWSPTAENAGVISGVTEGDFKGGPADFGIHAAATGAIGPVGVELALRSGAFRRQRADDSGGTIGGRVRVTTSKKGAVEAGPALRLMFPVSQSDHPVRLETAFGFGSAVGRWSWLVDVGTRLQLQKKPLGAYSAPAFLVGGGTVAIVPWLRALATLDAEVFMDSKTDPCVLCRDDQAHPGGGVTVGVEAGTVIFGALSGRLSPFASEYGAISAQATFGVRAMP